MTIRIKKRVVHLVLIVLLLLAASVTIVTAQQQQKLKQSAQTRQGYPEPPMYGCLQMGAGTSKSCASKLLNAQLKVAIKGIKTTVRKVYYNQTLLATLTISNPGDQPITIKRLGVSGQPMKVAKYAVDFQPSKNNFTLNPGQSMTLKDTAHTFNNPDPGGPWEIVSEMIMDNGVSVKDVAKVDLTVDTTCKALLRIPFTDQEIADMSKKCAANKNDTGCSDFCQIFVDKCDASATADACSGNCKKDSNPPTSCYPANTKGANGSAPACGFYYANLKGQDCTANEQCVSKICGTNKKCT
jgi:hypothetical protein